MNPPQVYMCSPPWTLLPPPSPYHPSGSSQCTSPKHPVLCIEPGLATRFIYDINPVYETAKQTLMYRTVLWTLWERERVGRFGRMALKHVKDSHFYQQYVRVHIFWYSYQKLLVFLNLANIVGKNDIFWLLFLFFSLLLKLSIFS